MSNSRSLEPGILTSVPSCPTALPGGSEALSSEGSAELDNSDFFLIAAGAGAKYYGRYYIAGPIGISGLE